MDARYADGRAAITHPARVDFGAEALSFQTSNVVATWAYADLARADDGAEHIVLKRKPDTGERIILDLSAADALRAAAPALCTPRAQGVESPRLVAGLAAAALSLAAAFLIGVPLAADPIAHVMPQGYRDQISQLAWAQIRSSMQECAGPENANGLGALFSLTNRLDANFDPETRNSIEIYVMRAGVPNAFTLPDDSIVITDQLIQLSESPDELAGVIAHELGHVEGRHVMTNVVRRLGAGVFFDIIFGGAGFGQAFAIGTSSLTSLGYTRDDETEADTRGLNMMQYAGIDPHATAALFERIAAQYPEDAQIPELLRSHPGHAARAAAARARQSAVTAPALSPYEWSAVRALCGAAPGISSAPPASTYPAPGGGKPGAQPPAPVDKGQPI